MDRKEHSNPPQDPVINGQPYPENSVLRAAYQQRVDRNQAFLRETSVDVRSGEIIDKNQRLVQELREREEQGILTKDEVNNILVEFLSRPEIEGLVDPKTGLYNENGFRMALARDIAHANRNSEDISLLYIDLVGFKKVNDTLGHAKGDAILQDVGTFLKEHTREDDLLARPHGDEFLAALRPTRPDTTINPDDESTWNSFEDRLKKLITQELSQFLQERHGVAVSGRVGIAKYDHKMSVSEFIKAADLNMNAQRDPSQGNQR